MSRQPSQTSGNERTLTEEPTRLTEGMTAWHNPNNGFVTVLLHYTADPEGASEEARKSGMDDDSFAREHDLSFTTWAGKAVYPGFDKEEHVKDLFFDPNLPIWRGWDFGYHRPAVVWAQVHGEFWVLGEVMGEDMTLDYFIDNVVFPYQRRVFGDHSYFIDCADPAGRQVTDKSEHTSFTLLANRGIFPMAQVSEINKGLTIIRQKLARSEFKIHPRCKLLIEGLEGGYRYDKAKEGKPDPLFPIKDGFYDHLQDSLRYIAVNAVALYEKKEKPKEEQTREARIYEKHKKGRQFRDPMLGDFV